MVRISEVSTYWMEEGSPVITLYGKWLESFGFAVGSKVVVDVTKGVITIKAVDVIEDGGAA